MPFCTRPISLDLRKTLKHSFGKRSIKLTYPRALKDLGLGRTVAESRIKPIHPNRRGQGLTRLAKPAGLRAAAPRKRRTKLASMAAIPEVAYSARAYGLSITDTLRPRRAMAVVHEKARRRQAPHHSACNQQQRRPSRTPGGGAHP